MVNDSSILASVRRVAFVEEFEEIVCEAHDSTLHAGYKKTFDKVCFSNCLFLNRFTLYCCRSSQCIDTYREVLYRNILKIVPHVSLENHSQLKQHSNQLFLKVFYSDYRYIER